MTNPLGAADFFALEAGECLDRLESLVSSADSPPPAELLRYARALRGSALMANHAAIARAAAGFEGLARAVRDRGRPWDAGVRERAGQAVDELRHLVRRVREWTESDAQRAARIASELDALAGSSSGDTLRPPSGAAGDGMVNTGVRAFVAREGALIASALDRAARTLENSPESREPLYAVLRRMQSLRGLAEIADLAPLPDVLDGIEIAVGDLTRLFAPPPNVSRLLDAAAAALTRVARDVADHGRPAADPDEAREFTALLLQAFATEQDVVPIESLFRDGDPDPVQRSVAQPQFASPAPLGAVELVSYGEHLAQAADRITSAGTTTARDLRLYALVSILRSVATPGDDPVTPGLAGFGRAARAAIGSGAAAREPEDFGGCLREAGRLLSGLAEGGNSADTGSRLAGIALRLAALGSAPAAAAPAPRAPAAAPPVSAPVFVPAPAPPQPPPPPEAPVPVAEVEWAEVVPIESLAPAERLPLERAFDAYRRMMAEAAPAPVTSTVPPPARRATDLPPVDIRSLCYSGRAALERAAEVHAEIAVRLAGADDLSAVEPLIRELLDLVPLAMEPAH